MPDHVVEDRTLEKVKRRILYYWVRNSRWGIAAQARVTLQWSDFRGVGS
jgi:hypothetical protein